MRFPHSDTPSCLVAGAGYVGLRVARHWQQQGAIVHAMTRSHSKAEQFRTFGLQPVCMDLANPKASDVLPIASNVLWAVGLDRAAAVPREQIWIEGLQWLVANLPSPPKRFVYVSSTSVYGAGNGDTVDETTLVNPSTEGGQCCVKAEEMLRTLCRQRFPTTEVVVLRLAGIYGPNRLLRRLQDLQASVPLPGDPDSWLNLIHVDDAIQMINHVVSQPHAPNVINVVNSGTLTRSQYYSHLAELAGTPLPVFSPHAATTRTRGGNKLVTSRYCDTPAAPKFRFNDVRAGLEQAFEHSEF